LWPRAERKRKDVHAIHTYLRMMCFTHKFRSIIACNVVGYVVHRRDTKLAAERVLPKAAKKLEIAPANALDFIIDVSKGLLKVFFAL